MDSTPALLLHDLVKSYPAPSGGRTEVLRIPHLEMAAGQQVALRGASGLWHQEHALEQAGFEAFQVTLDLPPIMRKS